MDEPGIRERTDDEILKWGFAVLEIDVGTSGEVRGLLKKDRVGTEDFAYIYGDFLGVKMGDVRNSRKGIGLTSFWAEKMEFTTGVHEFDALGETGRMNMRGSGSFAKFSGGLRG